jgi:hypothetical protein
VARKLGKNTKAFWALVGNGFYLPLSITMGNIVRGLDDGKLRKNGGVNCLIQG